MTTQLCTKCNKTKHLSEFNKDKSKKTGYRRECKTCVSIAQSKYRKQKYREQHKNSIKIKKSIYQKQNKEKINTWRKQWRQTPQGILSLQKQKLVDRLRSRIKRALENNIKYGSTLKLLGCSINYLKEHLQHTAMQNGYVNFDINNYSGEDYHIDHIIPCASFDLSIPEEQNKCFHYSNLQVLTAQENLIKSDKEQ